MENINELKNKFIEAIETILKDYESKQEPEFKVPGWYYHKDNDETFYVSHINNGTIYSNSVRSFEINSPYYKHCVPATPAEIESHLRKICYEKYIGKKVKDSFCAEIRKVGKRLFDYNPQNDSLSYYAEGHDNIVVRVYKQGIFAEIIEDKKKKPETREEFEEFMDDWLSDENEKRDEFLDQYDI